MNWKKINLNLHLKSVFYTSFFIFVEFIFLEYFILNLVHDVCTNRVWIEWLNYNMYWTSSSLTDQALSLSVVGQTKHIQLFCPVLSNSLSLSTSYHFFLVGKNLCVKKNHKGMEVGVWPSYFAETIKTI